MYNLVYIWLSCAIVVFIAKSINIQSVQSMVKILEKILMVKHCAPFIGGIIIFAIWNDIKKTLMWIGLIATYCLSFFYQTIYYFLFYVMFSFLLLLLGKKQKRKVNNIVADKSISLVFSPLSFFAKISYPLFLIHQFIGYTVIYYLQKYGLENEIWIIVPIIISVGIAWIINKYIEAPSYIILNRR